MGWKIASRLLVHTTKLAFAALAIIASGSYLAPLIGMGAISAFLMSFAIGAVVFVSVFPGQQSLVEQDAASTRKARRMNFQIAGVLAVISFVLHLLKL